MAETAAQLAEKVQAVIAEAAADADEEGKQTLYSELHKADGFVSELASRAAERDRLAAALEQVYVILGRTNNSAAVQARKVAREALNPGDAE